MTIINTSEDWWSVVDQNWPQILEIFERCGAPMNDIAWNDGPDQDITFHAKTFLVTLETAKSNRNDQELLHLLELCWLAAPDKPYIHDWPAWGHLCNLCSERWVFDPEEMQP